MQPPQAPIAMSKALFVRGDPLGGSRAQILLALGFTGLVFALAMAAPSESRLLALSVLPFGASAVLLGIAGAIRRPFFVSLCFAVATYYKIDEAYPALAPFRVVLFFAVLTLVASA